MYKRQLGKDMSKSINLNNEQDYITKLNKEIKILFKNVFLMNIKNIKVVFFLLKTIRNQNKAVNLRNKWEEKGLHIPPFIILSITNKCNFKCFGCYIKAQKRPIENEMGNNKLRQIFQEATELGISIILISGGEPLLRQDIFDITKDFPHIIFVLFTNGALLNNHIIDEFKQQRQIIPVISIEGNEKETDNRRGNGVFEHIKRVSGQLKKNHIIFGISLTITRTNFTAVFNEQFISEYINSESKLFFFVDYIPIEKNTENLVITDEQKKELSRIVNVLRLKYPALFFAFPSGEKSYGGCLAAGRGFLHINATGNVEPCPFAPYSDVDLNKMSLKEALSSQLLKKIRENYNTLKETEGGCSLWENREWVRTLYE